MSLLKAVEQERGTGPWNYLPLSIRNAQPAGWTTGLYEHAKGQGQMAERVWALTEARIKQVAKKNEADRARDVANARAANELDSQTQ